MIGLLEWKVFAANGRLVYIGVEGIRMKGKKSAPEGPVISPKIWEEARRSVVVDCAKPAPVRKCGVCGEEVSPNASEELCWVCRRLKISAWRDQDYQMPAQE